MAWFSDDLLKLWLARPANRKFSLICIVHNSNDWSWAETYSADWAKVRSAVEARCQSCYQADQSLQVGALRIMPISSHVSAAVRANLLRMASDAERYHLGYEHVAVQVRSIIYPAGTPRTSLADPVVQEHLPLFSIEKLGLNNRSDDHAQHQPTFKSGDEPGMSVATSGRRDGRVLRDAVIQGCVRRLTRFGVNAADRRFTHSCHSQEL
jgi:hypothetical protein